MEVRTGLWAPYAERVELVTRQRRHLLRHGTHGWWSIDHVKTEELQSYSFCINGGPPRPDPRSSWQPSGVHSSSRYVDHAAFEWTDANFQARPLSSAILYELHIGTFTKEGTFDSAIDRLEYLRNLGVTHVELMPVAEFPGEFGWGYDGVCLFAPRHGYGGPDGLKRLVGAAHAKGIAVILDVVYNHLGPSGNYLGEFGPYFSDRHKTPWGGAINFDGPHSDQVRRFFCDNALMWLRDYHVDGLRLDAVHAMVDTSALPFLEQLAREVEQLEAQLGRHFVLIAESDLNDPRIIRSQDAGGFGIDAQWCDDFHHALHTVLSGERTGYYADYGCVETLADAFMSPYVYAGRYSQSRQRTHGRAPTGVSAHRFVAYSHNHDQLGNRAHGERYTHLLSPRLTKIAAALCLLSPYVPQLFQGEEWGSTSPFLYFADWRSEPQLADAVRQGRQREFAAFGWQPNQVPDPTLVDTFLQSKVDWEHQESQASQEMIDWYRELIRLRRAVPQLTNGELVRVDAKANDPERWLVVARDNILIVANFAYAPRVIPLGKYHRRETLLASAPTSVDDEAEVTMAEESIAVFRCDPFASANLTSY